MDVHVDVNIMSFHFFFPFQFIDLCILLGCDYCDSIKGTVLFYIKDMVKKFKDHLFMTTIHWGQTESWLLLPENKLPEVGWNILQDSLSLRQLMV